MTRRMVLKVILTYPGFIYPGFFRSGFIYPGFWAESGIFFNRNLDFLNIFSDIFEYFYVGFAWFPAIFGRCAADPWYNLSSVTGSVFYWQLVVKFWQLGLLISWFLRTFRNCWIFFENIWDFPGRKKIKFAQTSKNGGLP